MIRSDRPLTLEEINNFCSGSMRLGGQNPSVSSSGRDTLLDLIGKTNYCQKFLALQLPTCFEMRTLSGGLVRSAPE